MKKIKELIIVEGKSDKQFLESFLDADIVTCNGSAIDGFDMEYVKRLAANRGVIILTDPDYPGQRIRNEISMQLPTCKHAFVKKELSIKHNKVGVAESTKEEVIRALENIVTFDKDIKGSLSQTDLFLLKISGKDSSINKEKIINHFHLGHCNSKTLLKRLNMLNIQKNELEKVLNDK